MLFSGLKWFCMARTSLSKCVFFFFFFFFFFVVVVVFVCFFCFFLCGLFRRQFVNKIIQFFFSARGRVCSSLFVLFLVSKRLFIRRQCNVLISEVMDTC